MALLNFDATTVPPAEDFQPLPDGEYSAMIVDSAMKPTKNGSGQYLQLKLQIVTGPFKNRILFDRLNLVNSNPQAKTIADQALAAICLALGKNGVVDSSELHNQPLNIKVAFKAGNGTFQDGNEVKKYKPYADLSLAPEVGSMLQAGGGVPTGYTAPAAPSAPAGAPPWATAPAST